MGRPRRTFSAQQKTQIALEALRERHTLSELAQKYDVHPTQITAWKKQVLDGLRTLFEQPRKDDLQQQEEMIALLYQQIGQLQFELDWLGAPGSKKNGQTTRLAYYASRSNPTSPFPYKGNASC